MIRLHSSTWNDRKPLILLAAGDKAFRARVTAWLEPRHARLLVAASSTEAVHLIQDTSFLGIELSALLVEHDLPDASGVRVVQEFQREHPERPAALALRNDSIASALWARARGVQLLSVPLRPTELFAWASRLRATRADVA